MKTALLALSLLSLPAWANLHLAPPDFDSPSGRAVFVDFKSAVYDITYDAENEVTKVRSTIVFRAEKTGKPLFDLVPLPQSVQLDGVSVGQNLISAPGDETEFRQVDAVVVPGDHTLVIENEFYRNVEFRRSGVSSAFWIRDLKDRMFLEQYVPSNFEFDQYQMTLNLKFEGMETVEQEFFTNGSVSQTSSNSWSIVYPGHFTVSCLFYHTSPKGRLSRLDFTYPSIDGRNIPVTVYSPWKSRTRRFKNKAISVMKELEADYGPWGHSAFVAYGTMPGTGGMEHAGATATSYGALDHEMLHSYFAKGVMPANGNSGWIDEAIASWRDKGYKRLASPGFESSDMGAHSVYKRNTDKRAYKLGAAFMAYLDYRLQDRGGLKAFLRGYFSTYNHQVITTEHFKNNLEFFSGLDLSGVFGSLIWGKSSQDVEKGLDENPHHLPLTDEQLRSIL